MLQPLAILRPGRRHERLDASLRVALAALAAVLVVHPAMAEAVEPPPPTVAITSPQAAATVEGTVTITAQASAGAGDTATSVGFYDGVNTIARGTCQAQQTCTASVDWRATGLSGPHSLTAVVSTSSGQTVTSAAVTVTVVSPPPTVSITSPAVGSTVKGTVPITAAAATAPSQADYPTSITFYDGVNSVGSISCQGQPTCQGTVNWPATGKTGPHSLTARVATNRGLSVTSAVVTVTVVTPAPTVAITAPKRNSALKRTMTVRMAGATDASLSDYPTSIELFDGSNRIGSIACQGQPTCAGSLTWTTTGLKGRHTLKAVIHTDLGVSATSAAVVVGQPARVRAKPSCHLSTLRAKVHRRVRGTCKIPGAPKGTKIQIKYRKPSGSYAVAVKGAVKTKGAFSFSLTGTKHATFRLAIVVLADRKYVRTSVPIGTLRIV